MPMGAGLSRQVLLEPKRNIRIWLQDGSNDLDVRYETGLWRTSVWQTL